MSRRHPFSWLIAAAAVAATLLGGCQTPAAKPGGDTAKPNFGLPMQDARTEAVIQQMELDYIAAKNSRPTYHHLALAEKKAKEEAEAEAARKAEAAKAEPTKDPDKTP